MFYVVTGGSGSGKSEYAERLALEAGAYKRIYVATMRVWDGEGKKRVSRHRAMRAGKGFETVERFTDLKGLCLSGESVVLLECMSNLAANEFYRCADTAAETVIEGVEALQRCSRHLIVVTNEVCSDGEAYSLETLRYMDVLSRINRYLGQASDRLTEVVFGIPVELK